jgi:hypothetical protein
MSFLQRGPAFDTSIEMHDWPGASGLVYTHSVWPFSPSIKLGAVNYLFVRRDGVGTRRALYAGETSDSRASFSCHEKFEEALRLGANEIHVHFASDRSRRQRIEADLRFALRPQLNEQPSLFKLGNLAAGLFGRGATIATHAQGSFSLER